MIDCYSAITRGRKLLCPKKIKNTLLTSVMLLLLAVVSASAQTLTLKYDNVPFAKAISDITKKTGYEFVFDASFLKKANPVTLDVKNGDIQQLLEQLFAGQPFSYEINNKTIVIKAKSVSPKLTQLNGRVLDSLGIGLPNVIVRVKNTNAVAQTGADGRFSIPVSGQTSTLTFSLLGYKEKQQIYSLTNITGLVTVTMSQNTSLLSEVVINGFQTISKERSSAAYTYLDSSKLNQQINVDLLSAMEGRVAGLYYNKNPYGASADQPVLRGIGTYSATVTTSPLIVLDGLPTETSLDQINPYDVESVTVLKDAAAASIYGSRAANGVIVVTTKKGKGSGVKVSFNADYFITTKPDISKMHYASTSDLIDFETDVYNRERARYASTASMFAYYGSLGNGTIRYYDPLYELYRQQSNGTINATQVNNTLNQWRQNDYIKDYTKYVWQDEIRKRFNLSLTSSSAKSSNFTSLNYDEGQERMRYNQNRNFALYTKSTYNIKKWLKATIGFNGTYRTATTSNSDYSDYTIQPRYTQIMDSNGNKVMSDYVNLTDGFTSSGSMNPSVVNSIKGISDFKSTSFNILDAMQEGEMHTKALSLRAFADLNANIYKGLTFQSQFQYEGRTTNSDQYYDASSYKMRYAYNALTSYNSTTSKYVHTLPDGGRYYQLDNSSNNYTIRNQFAYDNTFGSADSEHAIAAIAGVELRETNTPRTDESLRYGYDPLTLTSSLLDVSTLSKSGAASYLYGTTTLAALGTKQTILKHRYFSSYANMSYTYNRKYNLTGSIRVDRADLFGADPAYRNRPLWSIGGGWNLSNEDFLKDVNWISSLKLRATYGINGNVDQTSSPYLTATIKSDVLFPSLQYTNIVALPNPKLRWEETTTTNIGVDYALFKNRLHGSVDWYNKYSSDLLIPTALDPTVGTTSRVINNGALKNRGIEVTIGGEWYQKHDLTLSSTIVFAYNKNTVKEVNTAATTASSYVQAPSNYFFVNTQYNTLYAYKYGGMTNGYPYFLDENGQANVTFDANGKPTSIKDINSPAALVNMGSLIPLYTGSFSQKVSYKNFELSALLVFSGGNKLRKDVTSLSSNTVTNADITQRWKAGATNALPRLLVDYDESVINYANTLSSLWQYSDVQVLDASYIKLRNVALAYNLSKNVSKALHLGTIRITGQVNNLWYWSKAGHDIDPEAFSGNSGTRGLPIPKSFLFGLNVNF